MHGNGYSDPADDFGIGVIGTATGNVLDSNIVAGNTQGIFVAATARGTTVRENTVVGNPPIQTANTRPDLRALDIVNLAPAGRDDVRAEHVSLRGECAVSRGHGTTAAAVKLDQVADRRHRVDDRGAAGAKLMSAPASPGRTWHRVGGERRVRALARAFPAVVRVVGRLYARVSGVARVAASASSSNSDDAAHSLDKSRHEPRSRRGPRRPLASLSVAIARAVHVERLSCRTGGT